jgi:hypothetical protein
MTAASDERALREDQSDHKNHQQQREDPSSDDVLACSRFSLSSATNGNHFALKHFRSSKGVIAVETRLPFAEVQNV